MNEIFMEYFVPHGTKYSMMWMNILAHGHGWELLLNEILEWKMIMDETYGWKSDIEIGWQRFWLVNFGNILT